MYSVSFIHLAFIKSVDILYIVTITMPVNERLVDCLRIKHTFNKLLCLVKEC